MIQYWTIQGLWDVIFFTINSN